MDELQREFLENRLLDWIEVQADIQGLDGWRIADVVSYYLAGDPRFNQVLNLELTRQAIINRKTQR